MNPYNPRIVSLKNLKLQQNHIKLKQKKDVYLVQSKYKNNQYRK